MSKLRKTAFILTVTLAVLCCSLFVLVTIDEARSRQEIEGFLDNINVSDGINEREAEGIAWAYFVGYISGCGGPDKSTLVNGEWIIPASEGMGGRPLAL